MQVTWGIQRSGLQDVGVGLGDIVFEYSDVNCNFLVLLVNMRGIFFVLLASMTLGRL